MSEYLEGIKKGLPVGLGYLSVGFAYGVYAVSGGLSPLAAIIVSMTNVSSAGQFTGTKLFFENASLIELFVTVLLINLRYILMSLSLSQKVTTNIPTYQRLIMGFGITDEVYGVAVTDDHPITFKYMMGIILLPYVCWQTGTILGLLAANFFSPRILDSLNITLYVMFIAIIIPDVKKSKKIALIVFIAIVLSCMFEYLPVISSIGLGFKIIIVTVISATIGAILFPIPIKQDDDNQTQEGEQACM